MVNDSMCAVVGFVASTPKCTDGRSEIRFASFRMGTTERYWDRRQGAYVDGKTSFLTVKCRRALARNVESCLRTGDPIIAYGRLRVEEWTASDGSKKNTAVIEAVSIGHDLVRGTSMFRSSKRQRPEGEPDAESTLVQQVAGQPVEVTRALDAGDRPDSADEHGSSGSWIRQRQPGDPFQTGEPGSPVQPGDPFKSGEPANPFRSSDPFESGATLPGLARPEETNTLDPDFGIGVEPVGPHAIEADPADPGDEESPTWDPPTSTDAEERAT